MSDEKKFEKLPKPRPDINTEEGKQEVLKRAAKGDESVGWYVKEIFDRDEREGGKLLQRYADSFTHTARALVKAAAGKDIGIETGLLRKIGAVREELAGPSPTPLERILAERVALCWFDAHEMDRQYIDQSDMSLKQAEYRESRRDRAHRRFLVACKTLATVRRLGVPAIQVNVARQQVNVAGSP